jgi:hypothetical protein
VSRKQGRLDDAGNSRLVREMKIEIERLEMGQEEWRANYWRAQDVATEVEKEMA